MEERMSPVYKCWNCGDALIKASTKERGLIKSQVIFFEGDQLIGRCKKCGQNNILPITIAKSQFAEPTLTIPIKNNLRKAVDRRSIGSYNSSVSRNNSIVTQGQKLTKE